jgi:CRISPR system Cascade subunit CasC
MSQFIQLHLLTSYPPSNLNRDDLGRPKTAKMGGFDRLRISSQSLKRTWRVSDIFCNGVSESETVNLFDNTLPNNIGVRTKKLSPHWVTPYLVNKGIDNDIAVKWSKDLCRAFGPMENDENKQSQLTHVSGFELLGFSSVIEQVAVYLTNGKTTSFLDDFISLIKKRDAKKKSDDIKKANDAILKLCSQEFLERGKYSVDIALFGRMLASSPAFNADAACQVAHALSVHSVVVEDDYFTAVDDLNDGKTDSGSAHIGESGFAAAIFYSNININKTQLIDNLNGDETLANRAIQALVEAAVKVSPKGKQNSFASSAYASFALAEKGEQQPRNLSVAFLKPVNDEDQITAAIKVLQEQVTRFDEVYGKCADSRYHFDANKGEGSLAKLLEFVAS